MGLARWTIVAIFVMAASARPHAAAQSTISPDESLSALLQATPLAADLLLVSNELRSTPVRPLAYSEIPPAYSDGRLDRFWVGHAEGKQPEQIEAELRVTSRHAYWYVQRRFSVSDGALQEAAREFEGKIYPGVRRLIGSEAFPGLDNDPRITILHAQVAGVAGYVTSSDSYPTSVNPYSNQREIVYLNINAVTPGAPQYLPTLAHELTHLVHAGLDLKEDTWIKEGVADLTASLVRGEQRPQTTYALTETDIPLLSWAEADDQDHAIGAHYRVSELFLRYFVDRFGPASVEPLLSREGTGIQGWSQLLARGGVMGGFSALFGQWGVANVLGPNESPLLLPYRSARVEMPGLRQLGRGESLIEKVAQFGVDYFELPAPGAATVSFFGDRTVPVLSDDTLPASFWVTSRADGTVSHLACTVSVPASPAPQLAYRLWYDIEQDYDFAYVGLAPAPGGAWSMVRTPQMTVANLLGTNLGAGYTGKSGGAAQARWLDESIDMTAYAGQDVLVRFSYVTDDALTREGVALDRIRVTSGDDGGSSSDCSGPTAQGWAQVGPSLPQEWLVQVVELAGGRSRVHQLEVDADGRATWSATGPETERVILAIAAVTPATLQRPTYRVTRD